MTLLKSAAFFISKCQAIHAWDTIVFFQSNPASSTFRGSVSYCSADGKQNTELLLGRHYSQVNADVGTPIPSSRLVRAPPDDQVSIINARPE